ncbi:MAG: hypothetical protein GF405_03120 [Candidatus Eisenbacteria bacterium]|nr:hypothetical protein [Candidatus Eisenbacteria bacterium]
MEHRRTPMFVTVCIFALCGSCLGRGPAGTLPSDEQPPEQPGLQSLRRIEVTEDGAWSWLPDARAVCHAGSTNRTYIGWVDGAGEVWVASYDHASRAMQRTPLTEGLGGDDHSNPSLLVLEDGRIMAFYSAHGGSAIYSRTTLLPEDVTAWSDARAVTAVNRFAGGHWGYTYPNAVRLADAESPLFLFFRGPDFKQWFVTSTDGLQWSSERQLMVGAGSKPYFKYAPDGAGSVHIAFTDGHPRGEPENSIYYLCYRDGAFYEADGTQAAELDDLPFSPDDADTVYGGSAETGRAWVSDISLDGDGRPVVVYATFPEVDDHRCYYARWDGSAWVRREVTRTGSSFATDPVMRVGRVDRPLYYMFGGASIDPLDASRVYVAREVRSVYEIERWCTPDSGRTWTGWPITRGSSVHNVRPFVPWCELDGGPEVLWLSGTYDDYDSYEMSLQMMVHDSSGLSSVENPHEAMRPPPD